MPIKGMTDTQRATFPRIGVLRKGAPKPTNSNAPGKDLEWFRFVTEDQDAAYTFSAAFGENPASIGVMLPFGTLDENLEAWMEEWGAGSLKHRCDGEYCAIWQDPDGTYHEAGKCRCGAVHPPEPCPGKCKPTGRLMVIIPELRRLAYVQVLTTSKHDILELTGNLKAAEDTARMMGRDLRGIPFILTRVPREISTPPRQGGNGKRIRAEKWLLHIEPAPSWVALQIEAAQRMALPMIEAAPDIPYPNGNDDDDVIVAEAEIVDDSEPETNDNDKEDLEYLKSEFFGRVLDEIPFFSRPQEVGKVLKAAGFTAYSKAKEGKMLEALEAHAKAKADEEAAKEAA